jgi:hypothetical protein
LSTFMSSFPKNRIERAARKDAGSSKNPHPTE